MNSENLSVEQEKFLEQCERDFVDRYSDSDEQYKKVYDSGIPSPPIMSPWYNRYRFNNDRQGGIRNSGYQQRNRYNDSGRSGRDNYSHPHSSY